MFHFNDIHTRSRWAWPYIIFLFCFVVMPLVMIVIYAFEDNTGAFTLNNFARFFTRSEAINTFFYSLGIAFYTTLVCFLLGFPAAYFMGMEEYKVSTVLAMLFILPMSFNSLLRTIATVEVFSLANIPLGEGTLMFGMVYNFLPFMIYPIYNTIQKMDKSVIEAARDLGANRKEVFIKIIFPLSMPGVYSGIAMVFMPTVSTFAITELLTRNKIKLFGSIIQENIQSGVLLNYGAALSFIMLVFILLTNLFNKTEGVNDEK